MTGFEGFGLWSIAGTIATVIGGLVTPTNIETYISLNVDPWDQNETIDFMEPMGSFGIQTDLGDHVRLFAANNHGVKRYLGTIKKINRMGDWFYPAIFRNPCNSNLPTHQGTIR